ncbi:hypothetical protein [Leptospira sarikeiensis]|uniref:Alpha/beta hydrolase n=1 Tax=Leptospira sarikeiensis TaxID=2484943 RepID=A0A4R9K3K8_9LEPT|nr:hypothetical protein [Leptospira sarikeiensis]TGL59474.1 hypothetical protein EHQ64_15380 [Leptospira sarikeiensis]
MRENHWTFTSRGNPKKDEVLWLRDPLRSFDRSFYPELSSDYYLTVAEAPEKFSGFSNTDVLEFLEKRKKKQILIVEGFSARIIWPLISGSNDKILSAFFIFPNPSPVSGYQVSILEKTDWFLRNLTQIPKFLLDPFGLEKIWTGLEKESLYSTKANCPIGILLPRTVGPLHSQVEILQNLSPSVSVFRWETQNPGYSEPTAGMLSKILEPFLKSGGQKPTKDSSRTRF